MGMKRILLSLGLLLAAGALHAQAPHELHFGFSGPAAGYVHAGDFGPLYHWGSDLYSLYEGCEQVDAGPVFSIGYTYTLRDWLKPGAEVSWGCSWINRTQPRATQDKTVQHLMQNYLTVMPLVSLFAVDRPHFKLYGKLAAGGQLSIGDFEGTRIRPAWQVVPIGLQWGGKKLFGFAEGGYGNVYLVRMGLGIRW